MGSLSPWHWAIIAILVVVLFGAKKLPDAARSLGKSMRIFKSEMREMQSENKSDAIDPVSPAPVQSQRVDPRRPPSRVTPRHGPLSTVGRR